MDMYVYIYIYIYIYIYMYIGPCSSPIGWASSEGAWLSILSLFYVIVCYVQ